ncbi:MAG: ABC transporter ATP-binding protein [Phycisphaerales bacterium]|nr:ABC transporter ATP-binding protein [Phycisphaerales bacterium]
MTSLRLESVRKCFDETVAVDDVSLEVPSGSLQFLLGSSGCGKTTLLRMIAGFVAPTSGRIFFSGRDVTALPPEKRNAGMVFQNYALWPHMTVAQNVGFGLDVRKMPTAMKRTRIGESLELVRMSQYADRSPNQLSGGQQQRVALARAVAFRPDLLLLDEPLSNLDARLRLEMRAEIRRISLELKMTMIYVTHDQHEALSLADKVAVISAGRIEQLGTPAEVYQRPRTKFVAEFIGETNFVDGVLGGPCDADGFGIVSSNLGSLRAFIPERLRRAGPVVLSIRPEAILMHGESQNTQHGATALTGRCIDSVYLGSSAQHIVEVRGHRLKISETNPTGGSLLGTEVHFRVIADQVIAVDG